MTTTTKKPRTTSSTRKNAATASTPKKAATPRTRTKKTTAALGAPVATMQVETPRESEVGKTASSDSALQGGAAPTSSSPSPETLHRLIAEAAYYRAERRGFAPGNEELDWFEAEAEVRGSARAS